MKIIPATLGLGIFAGFSPSSRPQIVPACRQALVQARQARWGVGTQSIGPYSNRETDVLKHDILILSFFTQEIRQTQNLLGKPFSELWNLCFFKHSDNCANRFPIFVGLIPILLGKSISLYPPTTQ